jgi:S-adenosylmethionine decarboxylase
MVDFCLMDKKLLPIPTRHKHVGKHLVLDAWRISTDLLDDPEFVRKALKEALNRCGATLINLCVHQFSPYGVTATATLAESHMAVHTWPEHGYLGADLFFCGAGNPEVAMATLVELFDAKDVKLRRLNRGIRPAAEADDLLGGTVESV